VVVASGSAATPVVPAIAELLTTRARLGFAAAVNAGIDHLGNRDRHIAVLNDDAAPAPDWLASIESAFEEDPSLAAVQGTVTDAVGATVDGRGIRLDEVGLPVQVDRGDPPLPEPPEKRPLTAVSGTVAAYRTDALRSVALAGGAFFDPSFGSYHEDLDLGLRLRRLGWSAAWIPGALSTHVGSATGGQLGWRHPWWVLTNRWRALAGNLTGRAIATALPRLLRGEARAVRTLVRDNPRALPTAPPAVLAIPWIVVRALRRSSPGPRLDALPEACR
jgi:GT2 family glycosyltransferase